MTDKIMINDKDYILLNNNFLEIKFDEAFIFNDYTKYYANPDWSMGKYFFRGVTSEDIKNYINHNKIWINNVILMSKHLVNELFIKSSSPLSLDDRHLSEAFYEIMRSLINRMLYEIEKEIK